MVSLDVCFGSLSCMKPCPVYSICIYDGLNSSINQPFPHCRSMVSLDVCCGSLSCMKSCPVYSICIYDGLNSSNQPFPHCSPWASLDVCFGSLSWFVFELTNAVYQDSSSSSPSFIKCSIILPTNSVYWTCLPIFAGFPSSFRLHFLFSSSGPKDPMSLCHGVASVVRPSVLPSVRPQFSKCFFFVISQPILILIVS